MLVLDPVVVAVRKLPPWVIALSGVAAVAALIAQRMHSVNNKSPVKPRKIHSLGTKIPIIGDMLEVNKHAGVRHDWLTAVCLRFQNDPWQINIPGTPKMTVISDPATVEDVTITQFDNFAKGAPHRAILHDILGDGIVNSDGEHWYHQRKIAAKFFSARTLRLCMMQTMQRNIQQVYCELDLQCGTGRLTNLTNLFHQFTLQTFLEVGVGIDTPISGKNELDKLRAVDEAVLIIMKRRLVPHYVWKLQRWLNIGPEKKVKDLMGGVYAYIGRLVDQSLSKNHDEASGHNQDKTIRTAIDLFVEHSGDDTVGLRPRDLVDFVLNFVIAARDTSSMATLWFFYRLSKHPEVEAKIREELATKLKSLGVDHDGYITTHHVKQLVYLEATIKETLRLHPTAPFMVRQALQDTVLDGDVIIRKGQTVGISVYAMARNPRVWGPDAAEFKPERWIDTKTGELLTFPATKFFTFSAGPRTCIGMKLAMLNLRVLTANLLHRYKFEIDPANDGSHVNAIVLAMKHTLLAKVTRI
jgi:cytochrome P450